jgi:hypothetical protein
MAIVSLFFMEVTGTLVEERWHARESILTQ